MSKQKDKPTLSFEHKGIGHLLTDRRLLVVPANQREYAWEEEHVSDLFQDLQSAEQDNTPEYFLGTIVLTTGDDGIEVADGQQRLATVSIFLAAVRDYLMDNGETVKASRIQDDFLMSTDLRSDDEIPRLRLNVADHEFFRRFILAESPDEPDESDLKKSSHKKIWHAKQLAAEQVRRIIAGTRPERHADRLIDWVELIRDRARVIIVTVPDHYDVFRMFETLNDRGLELAQSDLLKNWLLGLAGDRMEEVQQRWAAMVAVLESIPNRDIVVTYLRHFYITRNGPTRGAELYKRLRETTKTKQSAVTLADALSDSANDYAALFNPGHEKWNEYGSVTRRHISTLQLLGVEQVRPLMLAVAKHFSIDEAKKAFKLFVSWSVRFVVAGGGRGGHLDRHYGLRAQEVSSGQITTAKNLAKAMSEVVPTDSTFEAAFSTARVSSAPLARYYLRSLEQRAKEQDDPELIVNDDEGTVNLEHILPQIPGPGWKLDPEIMAGYYKRVGNLALLQASQNKNLGNASFAVKAKTLAKSAFVLTAEAGTATTWDQPAIENRQLRLAKLAVETWPASL